MAHCKWCPSGAIECEMNGARRCLHKPAGALPGVSRTKFKDCRVHDKCNCDPWTYCYTSHTWPGTESDEWIEYIPEPK